jgi:hypothetical protein
MKKRGSRCIDTPILTFTLDADELLASRPDSFNSNKEASMLNTRLGGPQNPSGRCEEEKCLSLTGTRTSARQSNLQPVAVLARLLFAYFLQLAVIELTYF